MIEKAFDDRNSSRFQTLVARVEAKIRNHDAASVCASPASVAIAPATSSEVAPEFQNHIQTHDANHHETGIPEPHKIQEGLKTKSYSDADNSIIMMTSSDSSQFAPCK